MTWFISENEKSQEIHHNLHQFIKLKTLYRSSPSRQTLQALVRWNVIAPLLLLYEADFLSSDANIHW